VTTCKVCANKLSKVFCDLNKTPLANSYRDSLNTINDEVRYPLKVFFCSNCMLVQLPEMVMPKDIFTDYAYFSSYSSDWLNHASKLCEVSIKKFSLQRDDLITEIASNDGYLLKKFKESNYNNILGIEPAKNIANYANKQNINTENIFFNEETSKYILKKYKYSKIIFSLNVLAHVPNINSFVNGIKKILHKNGCWIIEFPHLLNLIDKTQFDTIYHEHFSYLSILSLDYILKDVNLKIFDIEKIPTHGGSLRVFVCHQESSYKENISVLKIREEEIKFGLKNDDIYLNFQQKVENKKCKIMKYLENLNDNKIYGFGAPAKATTLINYCKIDKYINYVADNSPAKQNKYIPGTEIQIKNIDHLLQSKPKNILVFPWNISEEIKKELNYKSDFDYKIHLFDFA
jgi:2-polyprenyl-3-methyl-5-hydroxy-6-metoxy-1,4-benzoquinol methylase